MHSHGHSHGHAHATGSILRWSLVATTAFVLVELVAGLQAHSLALLSDAGHNFTDALALGLAWAGFYLQSKPADEIKTYGYHRASVLSAFVNALTLVALSVWILYEAVMRLRAPEPVNETIMMAVAGLGLVMNGCIMLALKAASRNDINIRSAFVHMLGDALGSIAIIVGAVAIRYTGLGAGGPDALDSDCAADRLDGVGHHPRIAEYPAGGPAARYPSGGRDAGNGWA